MKTRFLLKPIVVFLMLFITGVLVYPGDSRSYPVSAGYCDDSTITIYPYSYVKPGDGEPFNCYEVQAEVIQGGYRYGFEDQSDADYDDIIVDVWVTGSGTGSPVAHVRFVSKEASFKHWIYLVVDGVAQLVFKGEESVPGTVYDIALPTRECADFTLTASPTLRTVRAGESAEYNITVNSSEGYDSDTTLTVSGLPEGTSAVFEPNPIPITGESKLTVSTASETPEGTYTLTITGQGGEIVNSVEVTLVVEGTIAEPDFSLDVVPGGREITAGESTTYEVTLTTINGFASPVSFDVSGLAAGVTGTFSVNPVTPDPESGTTVYNTTLTIPTSSTTLAGLYTFTITGQGGDLTHSVQATLKVIEIPPDPDFTIQVEPGVREIIQGESTDYTVTITGVNDFNSSVALSVSGLPAESTGSFSVTPLGVGGQSILTIEAGGSTPVGTYTLTVTGEGGGKTHPVTVTLTIKPGEQPEPDFQVVVDPQSRAIFAGETTTYGLDFIAINGFSHKLFLSIDGMPAGVTAVFQPDYVVADGESQLMISTTVDTVVGEYPLTITAKRAGKEHTVVVTLIIKEIPPEPGFELRAEPTLQTVYPGESAGYGITVIPVNGFAGTVSFSVSGVPGGVTAAFTADTVTAAGETRLQVSTTADTPRGTHPLMVTAVSGELKQTVEVRLVVVCPDFSLEIDAEPYRGPAPLLVEFEPDIRHSQNYSQNESTYHWNFGDGESSTEAKPRHTFQRPGVYNVTLSVTDACGRTKTAVKSIEVDIFKGVIANHFSKTEALPGDEAWITVEVTNGTRQAFTGIIIQDELSSMLHYIEDDSGVTPASVGNSLQWRLPVLNSSQTFTYKIKVKIDPSAPAGIISNTVHLSHESLGAGETITSNMATLRVQPVQALRVTLEKQVEQSQVEPGNTVTYRLVLTNRSNALLTNVKLADSLASSLEMVSQVHTSGLKYRQDGNELRWTGTVEAGEQVIVTITARVLPGSMGGTVIENTARFEAEQLPASIQSNTVQTIVVTQPVSITSVRFMKRCEVPQAEIGRIIRYHLTLTNDSTSMLSGVMIEDYLPQGFSYVASSTLLNGQSLAEPQGSRRLIWQLPVVNPGETLDLRYQVVIGADAKRGKNTNLAILRATDTSGQPLVYEASAFVNIASSSIIFYSELEGTVYLDRDDDDFYSMEDTPLQGIEVCLSTGQKSISDAMGRYRFDSLNPGEYAVGINTATLPPQYRLAYPYPRPVVLSDGLTDDIDFAVKFSGEDEIKTARLEGRVYFDKNQDKNFDPDEPLLKSFKAELIGMSKTQGQDGRFVFTRLEPGAYSVVIYYDNKVERKEVQINKGNNMVDIPLRFTGIKIIIKGNGNDENR